MLSHRPTTEEGVVYSWGDGRKGQLGCERRRLRGVTSQVESGKLSCVCVCVCVCVCNFLFSTM